MKTLNFRRGAVFALPLALMAGAASAGGLSEPVNPAPVTVPAPVVAAPVYGNDWTGFYAGGQLGYGNLQSDGFDEDIDGATYGVHAGYLYDFGSLVVGGEIDYDATNIEDEVADVTLDSVARAKLKVGYDAGSFLPYLTGGVAQASVSGATELEDTGTFAGLGMDYAVTDSIRVGAEVLQHSFEDFDDSGLDIDATTASARISFSF